MKQAVRLHETRIESEVAFHDVDSMRIVWHGHYYKYFELGRTALLRSVSLDNDAIGGRGYRVVVVESKCRHAHPLRYGERFEVAAWFRDIKNRLCIDYEITNLAQERRSARGHTILAWLDESGQLLLETPRSIHDALSA
jgi:acyl-CoA thioester hydrolase